MDKVNMQQAIERAFQILEGMSEYELLAALDQHLDGPISYALMPNELENRFVSEYVLNLRKREISVRFRDLDVSAYAFVSGVCEYAKGYLDSAANDDNYLLAA